MILLTTASSMIHDSHPYSRAETIDAFKKLAFSAIGTCLVQNSFPFSEKATQANDLRCAKSFWHENTFEPMYLKSLTLCVSASWMSGMYTILSVLMYRLTALSRWFSPNRWFCEQGNASSCATRTRNQTRPRFCSWRNQSRRRREMERVFRLA